MSQSRCCINELAVIYCAATLECLCEEIILRTLHNTRDTQHLLTGDDVCAHVRRDACLFGIIGQSRAHLLCNRVADGWFRAI